jgi:hypothetical protein
MKLTLWLAISRDTHNVHIDCSLLLYKTLETGFIPSNGDNLILFAEGDNPSEGPSWQTKSRYMDANGDWNVELVKMIVDPNEDALAQTDRSYTSAYPWWSRSNEKPIEDILTENGWHEYN